MLRIALVAVLAIACAGSDKDSTTAGDGSAPAQAAAGASRDACSLITKQEVDAILGTSVTLQPSSPSPTHSQCDYVSEPGSPVASMQSFTLLAYWTGGEEHLEIGRRAAGMATDLSGGSQDSVVSDVMGLQRVEGLGDEAYFSWRTMSYVRKGDAALEFQLGGINAPARERFEALARAALSRL